MTPIPSTSRQAGFTLIELAISLLVIIEVLLAVLLLFDFSNKISHIQSNIADMQQSLRVSQADLESMVRMAGLGGLPFTNVAPGGAVQVRDNVPVNSRIGDGTSPQIVDGSDVLILRGAFTSPIWQINAKDTTSLVLKTGGGAITTDPTTAATGVLKVGALSPTNVAQSLQMLADAKTGNVPEALLLVSARSPGTFAVVELDPANSSVGASSANIAFKVNGDARALAYATLYPGGPTLPAGMSSVGFLSILEEHRYYVRKLYAIANNAASDPTPRLSRARVFPATDVAWGVPGNDNSANLSNDISDNVLDLQVALAIDTPNHVARTPIPGAPPEPGGLTTIAADPVNCYISEAANGQNDDWLYNSTSDDVTQVVWNNPIYYVRVNLLARTDRRDPKYEAPLLSRIEDRTYTAADPLNVANSAGGTQRQFRRRILQTVIDLRNL